MGPRAAVQEKVILVVHSDEACASTYNDNLGIVCPEKKRKGKSTDVGGIIRLPVYSE